MQSSRYRAQMGTNGQMATNGQGEGLQMGNARSYRWVRRGAPQVFNWARGYIVSDLGVLPFLPLFRSLALLGGRRRSLRLLTPLALPDHFRACTDERKARARQTRRVKRAALGDVPSNQPVATPHSGFFVQKWWARRPCLPCAAGSHCLRGRGAMGRTGRG